MAPPAASAERTPAVAPGSTRSAWAALQEQSTSESKRTAALNTLALPTQPGDTPAAKLPRNARAELLERNLEALITTGAISAQSARAWIESHAESTLTLEALIAADGAIVLRQPGDADPTTWRRLHDYITPAAEFIPSIRKEAGQPQSPLIHTGLSSPQQIIMFRQAMREAEQNPVFKRRLIIVHEDPASLIEALSLFDLTEVINDDATTWLLGSDAFQSFNRWLDERIDQRLPARILAPPHDPHAIDTARRIGAALQQAKSKQGAELQRLVERSESLHKDLTPLKARARLTEASAGDASLRIVLCTTRHSTYTRHSIDDLAAEYREAGHHVDIVTESDDSSLITKLSYLRAFAEAPVDLVIIVNYTRPQLAGAIPPQIPCICWIQDAMQHLLSEQVGAAQTALDLTAGNTMPELITSFGYAQEAAMPFCVPASNRKFHPGPIDNERRERFACDIAFVSNHSEPVDAMCERLLDEIGRSDATERLLRAARKLAETYVEEAATISILDRAEPDAERLFTEHIGRAPAPQELSSFVHRILEPLAGRCFRHRSLELAARVAERNNWSLNIYGRGWEDHPTLGRFAKGPVDHGEDLRACYQSAAVQLHLDPITITHQRVFECAFSGGLPMMRLHRDQLVPAINLSRAELIDTNRPFTANEDGHRTYDPGETGRAADLTSLFAALGLELTDHITTAQDWPWHGEYYRHLVSRPFDVTGLLGDLKDQLFVDEPTCEQQLRRAIEDEQWRNARSREIAANARDAVSTEAFARRLLDHAATIIGWRDIYAWEHAGRPEQWNGVPMPLVESEGWSIAQRDELVRAHFSKLFDHA